MADVEYDSEDNSWGPCFSCRHCERKPVPTAGQVGGTCHLNPQKHQIMNVMSWGCSFHIERKRVTKQVVKADEVAVTSNASSKKPRAA